MKTKTPAAFFLLFLWITPFAMQGQTKETVLKLKDCIDYSLKNNPNSTIYTNNVELAQQQKNEALAGYLPQINGSVAFDDNLKRQVTILPAGVFGPHETRLQFGSQYSTNASVQLDQTIYDQTVFYATAASKAGTAIADLQLLQNNENLIYNTTVAYYQVLIYSEQEKLLLQNEKKYTELLNVLKLQYDRGVAKKIDYDRVKVSMNNITSQKTVLETNKQLALNRLKNAMGMDLTQSLVVEDSLNYNTQMNMPATLTFDVNNRLDYKIQEKNLVIQDLDVKRKKAAFFPVLSGYARYGGQAYSNQFDMAFDSWFDYSSVGLKLSVPIFSGLRRYSQLEESKLNYANAQENMKLSINNFQLQYQNSTTQLLSSYTNLNNNKENLDLAKDVFESTSLQYQKGTASLSDFLNSDYAYKEAQSNYITSLLNFLSGRLDYEKSQGTLSTYIKQL